MRSPYLIGFGAGLVSAVLFASAATSSVLAFALLYLSPLPTLLAGLGWGWIAAGVAALSGAVLILLALEPISAVAYFMILGAPAALLCYLALLSRQYAPDEGGATVVEWYPPGRLVAWATGLAGGLTALSMLVAGLDPADLQATITKRLEEFFTELGPQAPEGVSKEGLQSLASVLARGFPAAAAIAWLLIMILNMLLAARIVEASGHALRPWPDIEGMTYPPLFSLAAAVSFVLAFAGGAIGTLATAFAGAFVLAYLLLGLVIVHVITRAVPFRAFLLAVVYLAILFLAWVALIVAALGLCDPILRLRERFNPPQSASGTGPND